jgi:HK97 family phage portal protein
MKVFGYKFIFSRESASESAPKSNGGGRYSDRAQYVNSPGDAMKVSAVFRAVTLISDSIGALPLIYKRRDRVGNYFKPYTTGAGASLYNLITVRPNRRQTAFILFKNLVIQVLLQGNAYVYIRRDSYGYPMELILLSPWSCTYDPWSDTYYAEDSVNGVRGIFSSDEILHFKNVSLDGGYTGISTIAFAAQTLGIAATAGKETLTRFATGGKIKGIYHNDYSLKGWGEYQDDQIQHYANEIQDALDSGQDIIPVRGDGKLDQLSLSSVDMQFLENVKFNVTEIARFFNVPKSKLFDDSNANYKSSEMATVEFYTDCLSPILTMIENEFNAKLVPFNAQSDYKFSFDISKLYTTDLTTKANWQTKQLANGLQTVNDLRRSEDLPPVEGGEKVFISCNVAPISSPKISGETQPKEDVKPEPDTADPKNG